MTSEDAGFVNVQSQALCPLGSTIIANLHTHTNWLLAGSPYPSGWATAPGLVDFSIADANPQWVFYLMSPIENAQNWRDTHKVRYQKLSANCISRNNVFGVSFTQGTVLHEALHNLTGLDDEDLSTLVGIVPGLLLASQTNCDRRDVLEPTDGVDKRMIVRFLAALCLSLFMPANASAQCSAPDYQKARDYSNSAAGLGSIHVSLQRSDFTLEKLLCLTETLKAQYRGWKNIGALIFTSYDAAMNFVGGIGEFEQFDRELRAFYSLDAITGREYLAILPFGFLGSEDFEPKIDLPTIAVPSCRLELQGRCLFALDPIGYPGELLAAGISGKVTLKGTIASDGTMTRVEVVEADSRPPNAREQLVRAAVNHLETWWLEPAMRADMFSITYSYVIDSSMQRGHVAVQITLPHQVTIRANPPD